MMHLPVFLFHTARAYSLLLPTTFTILTLRRMRLLCIMKKVSEETLVEQAVQNRACYTSIILNTTLTIHQETQYTRRNTTYIHI